MRSRQLAMRRIFLYCHDAYGLGNARRMMAIAGHLARTVPNANLLLASGSPVMHGFHLPDRVDYIKLPSVARTSREQYATRYLTTAIADTISLRSAVLLAAVADFAPDLVLVDKKPFGIMRELADAIRYLRDERPETKHVLVLRDILDAPEATIPTLAASSFERDVNTHFDLVAVLGTPEVFDVCAQYRLSADTASRVRYCGYLRSSAPARSVAEVRAALDVAVEDRLVVVTPGGGEDGRALVDAACAASRQLLGLGHPRVKTLVVTGPHAPPDHLAALQSHAARHDGLMVREFSDDMSGLVAAADLVVAMGGYNSVCDILTFARRAIVVPRAVPVREQSVRATRMAALGYLTMLPAERLVASTLAAAMARELARPARPTPAPVDLDGLPTLAAHLDGLFAPVAEAPVRGPHLAGTMLRVREAS
jgi:predicted glycosyltransferase